MDTLIECVPNFSEGRNPNLIRQITDEIEKVEGVRLLNVDPGRATNRTVVTFVGSAGAVSEAAFEAIRKAAELIDMTKHRGEHPRMGATDVCPFIPISGISMAETAELSRKLGARVGKELNIPVYLYEEAQNDPARRNLSVIRHGEYEGFFRKIKQPGWKPDYGPDEFPSRSGATVIGARDFLVAYNINLNTTSVRRANAIAFDVRETGRVRREGNPITGKVQKDKMGNPLYVPGTLKCVKAIGWYIEEYGIAQLSMNLTNLNVTPLHIAFDEVCNKAHERGIRVTGSELVGVVPLRVLLDAGEYFLKKQKRSPGVSEKEVLKIAIKTLGLDELAPFKPKERIIEYLLKNQPGNNLTDLSVSDFSWKTASESPAPGGGSVSAYIGALGAALGTMVANLSANKPGWDERWEEFASWALNGRQIQTTLLKLVDEDTLAFNRLMSSFGLPKTNEEEKSKRNHVIQQATRYATEVPYQVMELSLQAMVVIKEMAANGLSNSVSDAGVAALCARSAVIGAFLNVRINAKGLLDIAFAEDILKKGNVLQAKAEQLEKDILSCVNEKLEKPSIE